jgi:hypothetical protein
MSKSTKIIYASAIVFGGILAYMYYKHCMKNNNSFQTHVNVHHNEPFAFSDVKNSYVNAGATDLSFAPGSIGDNINGILTNFKSSENQVLSIGEAVTNEMDMGARDPRAIEGYIMNEQQYGAGTPNYRALAGYY